MDETSKHIVMPVLWVPISGVNDAFCHPSMWLARWIPILQVTPISIDGEWRDKKPTCIGKRGLGLFAILADGRYLRLAL